MPTVLLLDVSISMAHSIFKINNSGNITPRETNEEDIKTFFEVLKSTIQYFITTLQSKISAFMADPITLITYSSDVNVLIPFTKEFQNFLNEFITMDIRLSDRTDLINALNKTNSIIQSAFGDASSISTEIFIFTDQCCAFDENDTPFYLKLKQFNFPFIHQFHFISICIKESHNHNSHHSTNQNNLILLDNNNDSSTSNTQTNNSNSSKVVRINNYFRGTIDIIKLSNQIINNSSNIVLLNTELNNVINRIISTNYNLYRSVLAFGRLSSPITLYPNPMTLLNFLNYNSKSISVLSIIGYLPNKSLYNVPSLSRHVIIPLVSDSSPSLLPPLGPVLQNCLRNEKKTAIVYIQENWYAMINSTYENDVPVLALSLFEPGLDLPFLGEDLTCLEVGNLNDHIQQQQQHQLLQQQQQQQSGQKQPIQLTPPQLPFTAAQSPFTMSYNTVVDPNIIPYIKMDSIHSDFTKISRLFKSLPQKLESIIIECEKIRSLSLIYQPNLIKALRVLLTEEIKSNKIPDERTYYFLTELVLFLENPSEPINAISLANSINNKNPPIQQQQQQQPQQHYQQQNQQQQQYQQQNQQQQYQQQNQQQQQQQQQYQQSSHHSSYHHGSSGSSGRDHSSSHHSSGGSSNNNRGRKEKKQNY